MYQASQKDMNTQYWSKDRLLLLGEGGENYVFLRELAEVFINTSKKYMLAFKTAQEEHDHEQMKKMIHALKGMSLSIGAIKLSELSLQLESVLHKQVTISSEERELLEQTLNISISTLSYFFVDNNLCKIN
jgi:HPt (histidine-containing phosphotransfer) domain-containing protein